MGNNLTVENGAELFNPKEMQAILQLSAPIRKIWIRLDNCDDGVFGVHLSEAFRKIRIPSDKWEDEAVLMYNLDTARSKTRLSYLILTSSLKV